MPRRRREEIHVNNERWLISYADFITLLFAFFVVMYSISQINESKYKVFSETFGQAFHLPAESSTNQPIQEPPPASPGVISPIDLGKTSLADGVPTVSPGQAPRESITDAAITKAPIINEPTTNEPIAGEPVKTSDELAQISDLVSDRFSELIEDQLIQVSSNELWLQIDLKDSILFSSGNADPSTQAIAIFDEIAAILKNYTNPIQVEGFTDNVPIKSARYPTNWELSSARATAIVKILAARGVAPDRLAAVGYGEFQPLASNASVEGRAQNRRVAIMVAKRRMERPQAAMDELVPSAAGQP